MDRASSFSTGPRFTPFLLVDLKIDDRPPENGFLGWPVGATVGRTPVTLRRVFHLPQGDFMVGITGVSLTNQGMGCRVRSGPEHGPARALFRDFLFITHDNSRGLAAEYLQFEFLDLKPGQSYELTFWSYDNFNECRVNRMRYNTRPPSPFAQNPTPQDPNPYIATSILGGSGEGGWGDPEDLYDFSTSFILPTDSTGRIVIYAWNSSSRYTGQLAPVVNGFAIAEASSWTVHADLL